MTSHGLPHQVKSIQSAFLRGKNRDLLRANFAGKGKR